MPVSQSKPAVDDTLEQLQQEADALSARILLQLMADPERKQRLLALTRQVLIEESGDGFMKRVYAGTTLKLLPVLLNSLTRNMAPGNPSPEIGRLLTTTLQINNYQAEKKTRADKEASARRVTETIDAFLANLDLGELNQALDLSHDQAVLLSESLSAMLQDNHLGKLSSLAPAAVSAVNLTAAALNRFLRHVHDSPPDFLAGFLAGLINLLDAEALSELVNHKNELIRMLYIGDMLQGDGKTTALETAITNKGREVFRDIDPDTFSKKKAGTTGLTETVHKSLRQSMADYPELLHKVITHQALPFNARIRSLQATLTLLLDLPEELLAQSLADAIDSLSSDELSEAFGSTLTIMQTVHKHQPGTLGKLLTNIVKTIDDDDLTAAADIFFQEAVKAVKPLAGTVMPPLLNGLAELIDASLEDAPETTAPPLSRLLDMLKTDGESS